MPVKDRLRRLGKRAGVRYVASLPERLVRSASALTAGVVHEVATVALPLGLRRGKLYRNLVDVKMNRIRAGITVARDMDTAARDALVARLSAAIGKDVIAGFAVDPAILGGVTIRVGDRVYDGSVRKRLAVLRHKLLA